MTAAILDMRGLRKQFLRSCVSAWNERLRDPYLRPKDRAEAKRKKASALRELAKIAIDEASK